MALLELIALFALARVFGEVCERVRVPALIGEIFAGILLGPLVFAAILPSEPMKLIADLAVFFIVYEAGMEMTFRGVRRVVKESAATVAIGSFSLPFLLGFLVGVTSGYDVQLSLFLGLALSLTALPVSVRILRDLGWITTDVGQTIIAAGLLCDIAGLTILAAIAGSRPGGFDAFDIVIVAMKIVLFFLVVFTIERILANDDGAVAKRLLAGSEKLLSHGASFSVPLILVFGFSVFAEFLGMHFVIGTFFGSVIVAEHVYPRREDERLRDSISAVSKGFLGPLFFAYLGLVAVAFDPNLTTLFVVLVTAAIAGKVGGSYVGARLGGFGSWSASAIAVGMNGRGAMELVIALVGLELGILTAELFSILVLMGLITTLVTPFMLRQLATSRDRKIEAALNNHAEAASAEAPPRS